MYGLELLLGDTMNADEFKKQFPSLRNFGRINGTDVFTFDDVVEHCIDKQRVKDAIHKVLDSWDLMTVEKMGMEEQLLREMGLDGD